MSKARSRKGSSGPDSGDTDMEVFPDLHHKMSKKIAQLTKVIYHLNTKNEDHQSMMEAISYQHKVELDGVAKDAISRMTSAKELAEIKQKLQLKESSIEKLIKKHQAEKDKTGKCSDALPCLLLSAFVLSLFLLHLVYTCIMTVLTSPSTCYHHHSHIHNSGRFRQIQDYNVK